MHPEQGGSNGERPMFSETKAQTRLAPATLDVTLSILAQVLEDEGRKMRVTIKAIRTLIAEEQARLAAEQEARR